MSKKFLLKTRSGQKAVITVDDEDAMFLRNYVWSVSYSKGCLVIRRNNAGVTISLGRQLLGINENKDKTSVIHLNADSSDYRKNNLKEVSRADLCRHSVAIRERRRAA